MVLPLVWRIPNWEADTSHCLIRSITVFPSFPDQLRGKETLLKRYCRGLDIIDHIKSPVHPSTYQALMCWEFLAFLAMSCPTLSKFSTEKGQLTLMEKPHVTEPALGTVHGLHLLPQ